MFQRRITCFVKELKHQACLIEIALSCQGISALAFSPQKCWAKAGVQPLYMGMILEHVCSVIQILYKWPTAHILS